MTAYTAIMYASVTNYNGGESVQIVRDLQETRQCVTEKGSTWRRVSAHGQQSCKLPGLRDDSMMNNHKTCRPCH